MTDATKIIRDIRLVACIMSYIEIVDKDTTSEIYVDISDVGEDLINKLKENLSILQEECAELIQAISKYNRGLDENGYGVLEEFADVLVTTYAVELSKLFTSKQIDMACDIKLNRAYDRLPDNLKMEEDQI